MEIVFLYASLVFGLLVEYTLFPFFALIVFVQGRMENRKWMSSTMLLWVVVLAVKYLKLHQDPFMFAELLITIAALIGMFAFRKSNHREPREKRTWKWWTARYFASWGLILAAAIMFSVSIKIALPDEYPLTRFLEELPRLLD